MKMEAKTFKLLSGILILFVVIFLFLFRLSILRPVIEEYFLFCYGKEVVTLYKSGGQEFPYIATKERAKTLKEGYRELSQGMTVADVIKKMGRPDEYVFPYSSLCCCNMDGFTYLYYLNLKEERSLSKPVKSGIANLEECERYYKIRFDKEWNVVEFQEILPFKK